jgi:enoyl-CoA hydratase/carnithine racemase
MSDVIEIERSEGVALIRLNRPDARNAMNAELAQATIDAVGECQDARAIVLTGAGSAFCAGLDLRALGVDRLLDLPHFSRAVHQSEIPVIAAVNGAAVTGGFELALACDFIIGSPRARFADTHLIVGVYPGPVLVDLPRRVGPAYAREMSLTGRFVDAETALRIGLINHLVPEDQLVPFSLELAGEIASRDPGMVRAMRQDWVETSGMGLDEAHRSHTAFAKTAGFTESRGEEIAAHRSEVIDRARKQQN